MLKNAVSLTKQRAPSMAERLFRMFVPEKIEKHPWDDNYGDILIEDLGISREWLDTFPEPPDFRSKRVVEIGCGFGALCVRAARGGASSTTGIEIDRQRADTAESLVLEEFPDLKDRIEFADYATILSGSYNRHFDIVLSQNSFEHYEDPERVLVRMIELLKPGGRIYAGFGPLWFSPFGSHLKEICSLPWAHLWGGGLLLSEHNRLRPHDPRESWKNFGLNLAPLSHYRKIFHGVEGCSVIHFCHNRPLFRRSWIGYMLLETVRRTPFLSNYLTSSLFVVLQKEC